MGPLWGFFGNVNRFGLDVESTRITIIVDSSLGICHLSLPEEIYMALPLVVRHLPWLSTSGRMGCNNWRNIFDELVPGIIDVEPGCNDLDRFLRPWLRANGYRE